jgi:hypothetical protein
MIKKGMMERWNDGIMFKRRIQKEAEGEKLKS